MIQKTTENCKQVLFTEFKKRGVNVTCHFDPIHRLKWQSAILNGSPLFETAVCHFKWLSQLDNRNTILHMIVCTDDCHVRYMKKLTLCAIKPQF